MAFATLHLKLRIERDGKVLHRNLRGQEALTVGRHPSVDIMLYSETYPRSHALFEKKGDEYVLRLAPSARGEILYENSRLSFQDLIVHRLLPRRNGFFTVPITIGKAGYVVIDDVRVDFLFDGSDVEAIDFKGFSPVRAFLKSQLQDPLFKLIVAMLLVGNATLAYVWGQREIPPRQAIALEKVPERFGKFILALPAPAPKPSPRKPAATEPVNGTAEPPDKDAQADNAALSGTGSSGEGNHAELGVLGLIAGTGSSGSSSGVIGFLISEDLARGLNRLTDANRTLATGRGNSAAAVPDPTAVLALSSAGRGIDDLVQADLGAVQSVSLTKSGRVNLDRLGEVSGSQDAIGARSEESLRQVLVQSMGRLQYLYNKYLKIDPDMHGKLEIEATISAQGLVESAVVLSSDFSNEDFVREILAAIRRWRYESIARGQMKVVYPILFVKTG